MVAMTFHSDLGDSWEWADDPRLRRKILRARNSHRRQLHRLRDDPLTGFVGHGFSLAAGLPPGAESVGSFSIALFPDRQIVVKPRDGPFQQILLMFGLLYRMTFPRIHH